MNAQSHPILKSHPIPGDGGQAPGRITLREWRPNEEWVTHFTMPRMVDFITAVLHRFREAEANFELRVKEYLGLGKLPSSLESEEPIQIPERILQGIDAVREAQTTNMFNANRVRLQAVALGYLEPPNGLKPTWKFIAAVFLGDLQLCKLDGAGNRKAIAPIVRNELCLNQRGIPIIGLTLRYQVKENAGWRCAKCHQQCLRPGKQSGLTKSERCALTLTVHHRNRIPEDNRPENLVALCTACHLSYHNEGSVQTYRRGNYPVP
jgi:hypothetical protein